MWCVDDRSDKVIQFSPDDGTTISSFKSPAKDPKGITFDGKYLWISDDKTNEIYMVDPKTGFVIIIMDSPGNFPHGLAVHENKLWTVDHEDDMIYELKIRDDEKFIRKDKKVQKVTFNHNVTCFGPGKIKTVDVNIALPANRDNQTILEEISYNIEPSKIVTDKWGQKTAQFNFTNIKPGEKKEIQATMIFETYNLRYFIYPENVGSLEDIKEKYLNDDVKYQVNSDVIQQTINKVVGDETNAYWITRKLHQYLIGHLHYIMDGAWDTAPTVINNGHGSCSEYSFTFIALCKAAGIPTRYVGAVWNRKDYVYMDDVYHRWVEVYMPDYGWVPIDTNAEDNGVGDYTQRLFLGYDNHALVMSKTFISDDSNLGVDYRSSHSWSGSGSTDRVAEWTVFDRYLIE